MTKYKHNLNWINSARHLCLQSGSGDLFFPILKKTCFLKLTLLLKFWIQWYSNILNLLNILMMLNKCIFQWFWFNATTRAPVMLPPPPFFNKIKSYLFKTNLKFWNHHLAWRRKFQQLKYIVTKIFDFAFLVNWLRPRTLSSTNISSHNPALVA